MPHLLFYERILCGIGKVCGTVVIQTLHRHSEILKYLKQSPAVIGYCNGHNSLLNAVEYHRSSEVNVAATDLILLIGMQQDIEADYTYDTKSILSTSSVTS